MAIRQRGYLNQELGKRIKAARLDAGLTLEALADKCDGIGFNTIYKIENGSINITVERLIHISRAIKVTIPVLLKGLM